MKKVLLGWLVIVACLFTNVMFAGAATCSSYGGTCMPTSSCSSNNISGTTDDCSGVATCCLPTQSGNCGGTCVPRGSCSGGNTVTITKDCGPSIDGVCCTAGASTGGPGATTSSSTTEFTNPLKYKTLSEVLSAVLSNLQGIIAVIAVVFIVIGGIMYMMSAGDTEMIERAKKTWTGAMIGLAIALAAPSFLKQIKDILGGQSSSNADELIDNAITIKQIALNTLSFLLSVVGVIGIIGLVVGGTFYLTAYGNEEQIDKGKNILTASIIGIVIALGALVLVRQVASIMGVSGM